ncbi:MAG TPA: ABC transporter substrate-binding protein [Gemmatimonadales bacterium]|nr:ABC transporter substrate-binding protein [Gemmatimonadales bacterium]
MPVRPLPGAAVSRWTPRLALVCSLAVAAPLARPAVAPLAAQRPAGTVVLVLPQTPALPIPTLMEGPAAHTANFDVADQLFLRLAVPLPGRSTADERAFEPQLARSWSRRDSLTLVFDLDPRARWHDGVPVTARDVVFTFDRARDPRVAPRLARPLHWLEGVTAEGERRVVFRFSRAYAEQLYDATFHVQPLPAHLVARLSPEELQRSAFAQAPVGNGPYRWVRAVAGQTVELAANPDFFLGRPGIQRLLFRIATSPDARLNLLLSGEADAVAENLIPPLANLERLAPRRDLRLVPVPSNSLGYLLFNQRDRADHARPHPILADVAVRRALVLALDRQAMARAAFGSYAEVPVGPSSQVLWTRHLAGRAKGPDPALARRLLAERGWRDGDGDGILDRGGQPLALTLQFPAQSGLRRQMALQVQAQLRAVGVRLDLVPLDGPVWIERRSAGDFDIDFSSASQDPSPAGLLQSWSCGGIGGTNVAAYCDPRVDSLMTRAIVTRGDPAPLWREALRQIEADAPAAFLYAPTFVYAVHARYEHATLRPDSPWANVWRWSVRPGAALPRDRVSAGAAASSAAEAGR